MTVMKLYYFETPNARKACVVAKYLGSPVEFVRIDLGKGAQKAPEFLALNPNGRVPTLEDGDVTIWESPAIMIYLTQKAGSTLWPADMVSQANCVRWINWDTAHFSRHGSRLFWERVIKPMFDLGEPDQGEIDDATGYFTQFAGVLNDHLAGRDYLVGDQLSVADFHVASILSVAEPSQLPLDGFDEIKRWNDKLMEIPACRDPFPA